jgi:hypothetical protein
MWDFKFSRRRVWCSELSSGLYCRVKWLNHFTRQYNPEDSSEHITFMLFLSMGWDNVSELQSPTGLLFILQVKYEYGEPWWDDTDRGNKIIRRETWQSATLSTTNIMWPEPGANPSLNGERPATNRLSHGVVLRNYLTLMQNKTFNFIFGRFILSCDIIYTYWDFGIQKRVG